MLALCSGLPGVVTDCIVSEWSTFSECSVPCGTGVTTRFRTVLTEPSEGGIPCPALTEEQTCEDNPCPHGKLFFFILH